MAEVWMEIFNNYIIDYDSIEHLYRDGIIDEDQRTELKEKMLFEIIETLKSEVNNEQKSM